MYRRSYKYDYAGDSSYPAWDQPSGSRPRPRPDPYRATTRSSSRKRDTWHRWGGMVTGMGLAAVFADRLSSCLSTRPTTARDGTRRRDPEPPSPSPSGDYTRWGRDESPEDNYQARDRGRDREREGRRRPHMDFFDLWDGGSDTERRRSRRDSFDLRDRYEGRDREREWDRGREREPYRQRQGQRSGSYERRSSSTYRPVPPERQSERPHSRPGTGSKKVRWADLPPSSSSRSRSRSR